MAIPAGLPEFDSMRRRLSSQYSQKRSEADDALQRRFAASGMLHSGAAAKQSRIQGDELTRQEADAQSQLGTQEMQEMQRRKEIMEGRAFQTSEREGSQNFAAGEAQKGRDFTGGMFDKEFGLKNALARRQYLDPDSFASRQQRLADLEFNINSMNSYLNNAQILKELDMDETEWGRLKTRLNMLGVNFSQPWR